MDIIRRKKPKMILKKMDGKSALFSLSQKSSQGIFQYCAGGERKIKRNLFQKIFSGILRIIAEFLRILSFSGRFFGKLIFKLKKIKFQKIIVNPYFRKFSAGGLILAVLFMMYVENSKYSSGATFTWTQTSWQATPTGANANHNDNQTGFTDYVSKDPAIDLGDGTSVSLLDASSGSVIQTNAGTDNTGFKLSGYSNSNTRVVRSGSGASVELSAASYAFTTEARTSTGDKGRFTSIALNSQDLAYISYRDVTNGDLRMIKCNNIDCTDKNDVLIASSGDVGQYTSIVLKNDIPIISFYDVTNADLKVAICADANCDVIPTPETLDSDGDVGKYNSIGLNSENRVGVSYYDATNGNLKYVRCTNDSCSTKNKTTIDSTGDVGMYTSLEFPADAANKFARISYQDTTNGDLKYVQCTNNDCSEKSTPVVLDSAGTTGLWTSLALDNSDFASISYVNDTGNYVKFVKCNNASCSSAGTPVIIQTVDYQVGDTSSSIQLDSNDYPRIAYQPDGTTTRIARCANAGCSSGTTFEDVVTGKYYAWISMAIGSDDEERISHYVNADGLLYYSYPVNTYNTPGTYTSGIINTGQNTYSWGNLSWTNTGGGDLITMKARTCDDASCSGETAIASCSDITNGAAISTGGCASDNDGNQYIQYQANFSTSDTSVTPSLDDVTLSYNSSTPDQTLVSSWYDSTDSANSLSGIIWDEDTSLPSGTNVKFQIRTAPDSVGSPGTPGTPTDYMGPDGTSGTYFTSESTITCPSKDKTGQTVTCSVPSDISIGDGSNDQWLQYKLFLTPNGSNVPQLDQVKLQYVVNANPVIDTVSASQDAAGIINITYNVSDADDNPTGNSTIYFALDTGITLSDNPLAAGATTVNLSGNYSNLPTGSQTILIDQEFITCSSRSGAVLSTCTRAANNSRAASHTQGSTVWFVGTDANTTGDGSVSNGSGKSGTWTIKSDLDEIYNVSANVRVVAYDGQPANQISLESGATASLTVDTKDPTGNSFTIDHTNNTLTIATPSDDSAYTMSVSNVANTFSTFVSFNTSYDATALLTSDPATLYVRIKDAYGNYLDATAVTPDQPDNVVYYDTSNPDSIPAEYREFIAWSVVGNVGSGWGSYKVYRKVDSGSFTLVSTISDQNVNYYFDTGLAADTHYYYKVLTADTAGNLSAYSSTVDDIPDGQGGSDSTAPTISSVAVSNIETTSATVTWETSDELSSSSVGYSTDTSYDTILGNASMVNSHSVALTGLTPNTTYNIQVKSQDNNGNEASNDKDNPGTGNQISDYTFTTDPGPGISLVTTPSVSNNQFTVQWKTTTASDTYVVYSDTVSGGALVSSESIGTPDLVTTLGSDSLYTHTQTVTTYNDVALTSGITYYFYVQSTDASSNIAIDNNGNNFYEAVTTSDVAAPVISGVDEPIINNTSAAINWTTDEPATSVVNYGTTSGVYTLSSTVSTYDRSHYVILAGLTADTTYYYTVTSADINTNSATSSEYSFTTLKDPGYQHDALSAIASITDPPSIITDTKAVITFNTDQNAKCTIEYGTASGAYTEVPVIETSYNSNHSIHVTGLIFSTKYYYQITCVDNLDNTVSSSEYSFTTSAELLTETGWGDQSDSTAPSISGISNGTILGESATITWKTDEEANSLVAYGVSSGTYENIAGNYLVNSDPENYVTSHSVVINNLTPATKYYYVVISSDIYGNVAESSEESFTTKEPSTLSSIKVVSTALGQATITWSTSKETTSIVEYGLTVSYGETKQSTTLTKTHEINLSGLIASQTYHFRVKGKDADNNLYSSGDYTFEPKSPPTVSNIRAEDITEHSAVIKFTTNVPTSALVTYTDPQKPENSGSQGVPNLSSTHEVELKNLPSGVTFATKIKVTDEQGNSTEEDGVNFTVGKDETPPKIDQIRTDSALAQNDKVQTIVSWITDEPATTSFIYKEGKNGNEKETKISEAYADNHVAVITILKPGTVYYFKAKSVDESGNEAVSSDYALLTPRRKENIIQIIISNFQDIFGWVKLK